VRILVIEDDTKAARVLAKGLREEEFTVDVAHSGEAGEELASVNTYDAIVLDWVLPGKQGIAVCRDLRAHRVTAPILMLTARDAVEDRVVGLTTGADDYLTKPFGFAELLARLRALLRRSEQMRFVQLCVGNLTLDPRTYRVTRGDALLDLTRKEYAILEILMRRAGEAVARSELTEGVWEADLDTLSHLLEVHVGHLRRKLQAAGVSPVIQTVRGYGYLLDPGG
jgi:DNA-binding response OmpR family regulator